MPCEQINSTTIICFADNMYRYPYKGKSYTFELHRYLGPIPLTCRVRWKGYEAMERIPAKFWDAWEEFDKLTEEERKQYLFIPEC